MGRHPAEGAPPPPDDTHKHRLTFNPWEKQSIICLTFDLSSTWCHSYLISLLLSSRPGKRGWRRKEVRRRRRRRRRPLPQGWPHPSFSVHIPPTSFSLSFFIYTALLFPFRSFPLFSPPCSRTLGRTVDSSDGAEHQKQNDLWPSSSGPWSPMTSGSQRPLRRNQSDCHGNAIWSVICDINQ